MTSQLAKLVGRTDLAFDIAIKDLEKATGNKGIDVRLVGDVLATAHRTIRSLGLDSKDIQAKELYLALRAHKNYKMDNNVEYVGIFVGNKLISFNHRDIDTDRIHDVSFLKRSVTYMQHALGEEIVRRYKKANNTNPRNIDAILKIVSK